MTRAIEDLIPDYLRGLPVYVPGKPIEEVERELRIHAVKLASNENPLGPSPKGIAAAKAALADANRYPDGGTHALRQTLAERHRVSPEEIFIGLGSSELIDLAARIGYAIGRLELLSAMNKLRTPFNTSGVAQASALAALDDKKHVTRCIETNGAE